MSPDFAGLVSCIHLPRCTLSSETPFSQEHPPPSLQSCFPSFWHLAPVCLFSRLAPVGFFSVGVPKAPPPPHPGHWFPGTWHIQPKDTGKWAQEEHVEPRPEKTRQLFLFPPSKCPLEWGHTSPSPSYNKCEVLAARVLLGDSAIRILLGLVMEAPRWRGMY